MTQHLRMKKRLSDENRTNISAQYRDNLIGKEEDEFHMEKLHH